MPEDILDTHLHLVDRVRLDYSWLRGAGPLDRDWTLETYAAEAHCVGIARAPNLEVDVDPEYITAEPTWIEELAASGIFPLAGIISSCRTQLLRFYAEIERARSHPVVFGFRRILHEVPDDVSQTETFRGNIRKLAKCPNTCAKLSGVIAYGGPDWTLAEISRYVSHVIDSFDLAWLCWGGDWPVCTLGGGLSK